MAIELPGDLLPKRGIPKARYFIYLNRKNPIEDGQVGKLACLEVQG